MSFQKPKKFPVIIKKVYQCTTNRDFMLTFRRFLLKLRTEFCF